MPTNNPSTSYEHLEAILRTASKNKQDFYTSLRKNSQNVLVYLADELKWHNKRFYTSDDYPDHGGGATPAIAGVVPFAMDDNGGQIPPTPSYEAAVAAASSDSDNLTTPHHPAPWRSGYMSIVPIKTPDGKSPEESITKLVGQTAEANRFFTFEMTSAQASVLIPRLRVFKVDYKTTKHQGSGTRTPHLPDKWRLSNPPKIISEREIEFDAFLRSTSADEILKSSGYPQRARLPGTGIRSFEWDLIGVNPAEVDANITATLQVYFNSIDDVFFNNLKKRQLSPTKGIASFLDLIVFSPPLGGQNKNPIPACVQDHSNGNYFEIKVEVGWQLPPDKMGLFTDDQLDIIKSTYTKYFLQLTDHEFEFSEDGSAVLTANYRARSKMADEKFNILGEVSRRTENEQENLESAREIYDAGEGEEDTRDAMENAEETLEAALDKQYKRIIKELVTKHSYTTIISTDLLLNFRKSGAPSLIGDQGGKDVHEGKIISYGSLLNTIFNSENPRESPDNRRLYDEVLAQIKDSSMGSAFTAPEGPGPIGLIGDPSNWPTGEWNVTSRRGRGREEAESFAEAVTNEDLAIAGVGDKKLGRDQNSDGNFEGVKINYFYLGDILEVFFYIHPIQHAIGQATRRGGREGFNMGFAVMDTEFINPRKVLGAIEAKAPAGTQNPLHVDHARTRLQIDGIDFDAFKCGFDSLPRAARKKYLSKVNLANIPINAELFLDFLKEKIISQQRLIYYADDFITDLLNQFVKPIISSNGIFGTPKNAPTNIMLTVTTDALKSPLFAKDHHKYALGYDHGPGAHAQARGHSNWPNRLFDVLAPTGDDPTTPGTGTYRWGPGFGKYHTIIGYADYYTEEVSHSPRPWLTPFHSPTGAPVLGALPPGSTLPQSAVANKPDTAADVKIIALLMQFNNFDGAYDNNIKAGICNFVVGLDRGILKKVSFQRVDQPYLRESRISKAKAFGAGQLRELYNVSLEMFGNVLCKPGQIIYVEPNPAVFGKPTSENSPARILGLGGYHLVTSVSNVIDSNGWSTTVNALHVAVPPTP